LDFFFYATVPLGFAMAAPENAQAAAVLICAFVGTGSSFLAFAVIAAKRGMQADAFPSKGIFYLGGLTEGFETIVVFTLMCLWPAWFVPLAYGFAFACLVTTVLRWLQGWRAFSDL
jgi:phosphatidylglycerophosphate synthase